MRSCIALLDRGLFILPKRISHTQSPLAQDLGNPAPDQDLAVWEFFCVNRHLGYRETLRGSVPSHHSYDPSEPARVAADGECRMESHVGEHNRQLACFFNKTGRMVAEASMPYNKARPIGPGIQPVLEAPVVRSDPSETPPGPPGTLSPSPQ